LLPRLTLSLPAPGAADGTLLLHAPHLARPDIPPLAPGIAQDPLLHHFFAKALEQAILRLSITQSDRCQLGSPPSRRPFFPKSGTKKPACPPVAYRGNRLARLSPFLSPDA